MSKSDRWIGALAAVLLLVMALPSQARENYHLGRKATASEIAGWNIDVRPDGKGLPSITFLSTDTAGNKLIGEFLQSEWKKYLNIDLKLEFTDSKTRKARYNAHDFQLVLGGWQEDYPDAENWMDGLFNTGGSLNAMQCSMPEIDSLMEKARNNANNEERIKQWTSVEKLIIDNACGMSPIYHGNLHFLVKPYLKGMIEHKSGLDHDAPGDRTPENWTTTKK